MMSGLSVCLFVLVWCLGLPGPYVSWIVGTLCILDRWDPMYLGSPGPYVPWFAWSLCALDCREPMCLGWFGA